MKTRIANIGLITSIILIIGVIITGLTISKKNSSDISASGSESKYDDDYIYHLNEKTVVDFKEPIIEQFNKESQFVVSSVDARIDLVLHQSGMLDIDILNKSQKISYKGTGRYYIDMSSLNEDSISVNEEEKVITITVPHPELIPVEIDPDCFESEDAKKGFLAFGDLKFTPKEYNDLESECKTKLTKAVDTKENRLKANENAIAELIKIYTPIVKALDDDYSVCVEFAADENPII